MKRLLLIVYFAFSSMASFAQGYTISNSTKEVIGQPTTVKYYAEVVYTNASSPAVKSIQIDFGEDSILGSRISGIQRQERYKF